MFKKILIANRGEIAVRVIRACREMGIATVAVYSDVDRAALHVRKSDEAYPIGPAAASESYLRIDKILDVAKRSGAEAIHPGYGFLSENGDFAQAVIDAGLIWIGPSPQSIRDLGDKVTARHIAARAQAPLVPGTPDPVKDADEVVAFAKEYGVPIAIKAAFGGGGRSMKVARSIEEIPELFESATREAVAAFGRGECFVCILERAARRHLVAPPSKVFDDFSALSAVAVNDQYSHALDTGVDIGRLSDLTQSRGCGSPCLRVSDRSQRSRRSAPSPAKTTRRRHR